MEFGKEYAEAVAAQFKDLEGVTVVEVDLEVEVTYTEFYGHVMDYVFGFKTAGGLYEFRTFRGDFDEFLKLVATYIIEKERELPI